LYLPLAISATSTDTRSQHQNKKLAKKRLLDKIVETQFKKMSASLQNEWQNHLNIERANPVRIFKGTDFKKNKKSTNYKSKRLKLKNELKKLNY